MSRNTYYTKKEEELRSKLYEAGKAIDAIFLSVAVAILVLSSSAAFFGFHQVVIANLVALLILFAIKIYLTKGGRFDPPASYLDSTALQSLLDSMVHRSSKPDESLELVSLEEEEKVCSHELDKIRSRVCTLRSELSDRVFAHRKGNSSIYPK